MRRTYSKAGLSVIALYGVMGAVSGVVLGICAGIGVFFMGMKGAVIPDNIDLGSISQLLDVFQSEEILLFVIPGLVLGSAGGMGVGILIMRKILPPKNNIPIPKKNLSAVDCLLIAGMAYGLWGVGAFIGNLPEWFGIGIGNSILDTTHPIILLYHLYAIIGAPFFEELAFRKVLLDAAHPYGEVQAAFLSALLFGIMHGNSAQFMLAFTLGLLLASVYQRTGRVIYTMALHFMINLTATIPSLFALGGINIDLIWYIVVGALIIGGVVLVILFRKKDFLSLSVSGEPDANRAMFKNPGLRIAVIGGIVLISAYELMMLAACISEGMGAEVLLRLVPWALSIVMIILVTKLVGKPRFKQEPVQQAPIRPVSIQPVSGQPVSVQPVSAQPATVQPVSAQPASVQPVTAQPISAQPGYVQPGFAQETAAQEMTVRESPLQQVSAQEAPLQQVFAQEASLQQVSVQEAPAQEASLQQFSAQQAPEETPIEAASGEYTTGENASAEVLPGENTDDGLL